MHINVDMHWRGHRRLHKHIEHVVDIKVDDILDKHEYIHEETCIKVIANIHI